MRNHLKGLQAILEMLLVEVRCVNDYNVRQSYMSLEEAFAMYLSYYEDIVQKSIKSREKRKCFKELLCHDKYGLCLYVIKEHFVIL